MKAENYYAIMPLTLLCMAFLYLAINHPIHDFANYYYGGQLLAEGRFTTDIYFPYWFNQQIIATGQSPLFAGFAPNTPFLALLFAPLSALSLPAAKLVFNCISVMLFIYSFHRLSVFYKVKSYWLLLIPAVFFVPLRNEIIFGQVYLLLFFFVAEYWLAYRKQQYLKASVFLSLAILLKVFPLLLLIIFIFKKEIRPFCLTIFICIVFIAATLFFCSLEVWQFYITDVLSKASAGGIASAYVENYQSLYMFFKRILVFEQTENPMGYFDAPAIFSGLMLALKILIVGTGFYVTKYVKNELLIIGYWVLAIVLISAYGSTYTFLFMLFPFMAIAKTEMPNAKKAALLIFLIFINNFPLSAFMSNVFPFNYWRLFGLLAFFILFMSLIWKQVSWKIVTAVSGVALLFASATHKLAPNPDYFLKDSPLLIYDYHIENNQIIYDYWDQKGKHHQSVPVAISSVVPANLIGTEIYFFGKRIASDEGHKQKPVVISGKMLLYLSDADRGIGFYTLRKIDLK
jgi:hypothetical protein